MMQLTIWDFYVITILMVLFSFYYFVFELYLLFNTLKTKPPTIMNEIRGGEDNERQT